MTVAGKTIVITGAAKSSNNGTFTINTAIGLVLKLNQTNTFETDTSGATLVIGLNPGDKTDPALHSVTHSLIKASDLPMTAGGFYYFLGRDEPLLEWHLRLGREFGTKVHNTQIISHSVDRKPVTDEQVIATYLRAAEVGEETGVAPCFEVHVNMWSEHFGRIANVAEAVEAQGVRFNMTLDHSHVIFKIDNPEAQEVQGMRADVEAGRLELDPFKPGSVCQQWLDGVRKRLDDMLGFVEMLDRWYTQMLTVPKPKLAALIRLGTRIVSLIPFNKRK